MNILKTTSCIMLFLHVSYSQTITAFYYYASTDCCLLFYTSTILSIFINIMTIRRYWKGFSIWVLRIIDYFRKICSISTLLSNLITWKISLQRMQCSGLYELLHERKGSSYYEQKEKKMHKAANRRRGLAWLKVYVVLWNCVCHAVLMWTQHSSFHTTSSDELSFLYQMARFMINCAV